MLKTCLHTTIYVLRISNRFENASFFFLCFQTKKKRQRKKGFSVDRRRNRNKNTLTNLSRSSVDVSLNKRKTIVLEWTDGVTVTKNTFTNLSRSSVDVAGLEHLSRAQ